MNAPFLPRNKSRTRQKARIGALSVLPVFFNLNAKNVVMIGGTEAAAWKTELLLAAGAQVLLHCHQTCTEMAELIAAHPLQIKMRSQTSFATDVADARLIIADAHNEAEAKRIQSIGRLHGVPVNIIDQPQFCDFQFGSIVNRSPIVIGISTTGAAPILGQAVRRKIEALLPLSLKDWAELAQKMRAKILATLPTGAQRRAYWEKFVDLSFSSAPSENAADEALKRVAESQELSETSDITVIGFSPSDPELITLKAVRALQAADVIVYPQNLPSQLQELGRREATRKVVQDPLKFDERVEGRLVVLLEGNPCLYRHVDTGAPNKI